MGGDDQKSSARYFKGGINIDKTKLPEWMQKDATAEEPHEASETLSRQKYALLYDTDGNTYPYLIRIDREDEARPLKDFIEKIKGIDKNNYSGQLWVGRQTFRASVGGKLPFKENSDLSTFFTFKEAFFTNKKAEFLYGVVYDDMTIFEKTPPADLASATTGKPVSLEEAKTVAQVKLKDLLEFDKYRVNNSISIDDVYASPQIVRLGLGLFSGGALDEFLV